MAKILLVLIVIGLLGVGAYWFGQPAAQRDEAMAPKAERIPSAPPVQVLPISHATMVLKWGEKTIYVDPVGGAAAFAGQPTPDIVLVTDIHCDHLNAETIAAVIDDATLIVPAAVKALLPANLAARTRVMANDDEIEEQGMNIRALPMYNLPEAADSRHIKGRGNGYLLEHENFRVYIAGDTAGTPEMRALQDIDIAFIPMNLPFTMDVDEAANAVLAFEPRQVYPYHYRGQNGLADVGRFQSLVNAGNPDIEVILANWYPAQ